ncbi:arsenosugar biosynthesis radical SAM (seleno)protein ArsS [Candidatus Laterigemmans baculatus]|uniref:arsenosugar biosynthesis radical SAM (seleno)protein ArsS n=1 Tax=Candidatus Laterigemmans baculatus TaxID=2770505 RepID=UPI0013DA4A54|nr:arsenosugar biosynthesis radical SAM (seleno)protein ArsS [Candidatus Laterigemmans baculatus]
MIPLPNDSVPSSSSLPIVDDSSVCAVTPFAAKVAEAGGSLRRERLSTVQVNLGKLCNQACKHCHVEAGPTKTAENMDRRTATRVLQLIADEEQVECVDITGGAPELNPHFRDFVRELSRDGRHVIDRCNLTVLSEPGQEETAEFLAEHRVEVIASLPCYSAKNVDTQRGRGVFERSIEGLRRLNELGYGQSESGLRLRLVYNPLGPTLPPPQESLEADYKRELLEAFGIRFNQLITITNLPIKRFLWDLQRSDRLEAYMQLLHEHFNAEAAAVVMCRSLVSIGWDGRLYDCDFNQMLELPIAGHATTVWEIDSLGQFLNRPIAVADHCYGCTAGAGSSCTGSLLQ